MKPEKESSINVMKRTKDRTETNEIVKLPYLSEEAESNDMKDPMEKYVFSTAGEPQYIWTRNGKRGKIVLGVYKLSGNYILKISGIGVAKDMKHDESAIILKDFLDAFHSNGEIRQCVTVKGAEDLELCLTGEGIHGAGVIFTLSGSMSDYENMFNNMILLLRLKLDGTNTKLTIGTDP